MLAVPRRSCGGFPFLRWCALSHTHHNTDRPNRTSILLGRSCSRNSSFVSSASASSSSLSPPTVIRIGSVERQLLNVEQTFSPEQQRLIPRGYLAGFLQKDTTTTTNNNNNNLPINTDGNSSFTSMDPMALAHWQWLLQKDALRQDACLMGLGAGSGAIYRRRLLLAYAELVQQPVELVTLSNATTESDLKQKRTIHGRNSNIIISNNNNNNNSNDPICSADPEMMQSTPSATAQPQSTSLPVIGFQDQAPVRAALRGHLLILDGLHRAERNVLPTLNNLLENREIPLEDGRLLVSAERFAQLQYRSGGGGTSSNLSSFLVPVHPNFRVVASLTLEQGHTNSTGSSRALDPPVRSRFQYRRVDPCSTDVVYEQLAQLTEETAMFDLLQTHEKGVVDSTADTVARDLAVFASAMHKASCGDAHSASDGLVRNSLHFCPVPALPALWKLQMLFPHQQPRVALERAYPYASSEPRLQKAMTAWPAAAVACETLRRVSKQVGGKTYNNNKRLLASTYELDHVQAIPEKSRHVSVCFRFNPSSDSALGTNPLNDARVTLTVTSGGEASPFNSSSSNLHNENNLVETALVSTMTTRHALTAMLQEHAAGRDLLLVSPKGEGKNAIAKHFCSLLGYQLLLFPLYNEMTANDLLFRRSSTPKRGTTKTDQQAPTIDWEESPLLIAARTGQVCVLDGIEKLPRDTLAALQGFLNDREVSLPDGTKYLRRSKDHDEEWINANRTRDATVHPSFRVVALASTPTTGRRVTPPTWLSEEVTSMFSTIALTAPTRQCLESILLPHVNSAPHELEQLLNFHERLLQSAEDCGVSPLTTRTMLRLLKNRDRSADKTLYKSLCATLLVDLLAPTQRAALESVFHSCAIVGSSSTRLGSSKRPPVSKSHQPELLDVHVDDEDILRIGDFSMQRLESRHMELVPSPYFFDIPSHIKMIQTLLREWSVGERAFLLLGNQGTGKNKICDRLCELANFEREYIQLHRDSTIGQLTISPSLEDGKIVWKDSPLVRAVTKGRALIIDEADKAPPEVVAVLKSLVEDGELLLADGRKIIRSSLCLEDESVIPVHSNFTVWVLANRAGKLFHGNRFEIMDCFSTHVVPNPDLESEIKLLQSYAPNVDVSLIRRLSASFDELRNHFEHGEVTYPYSTREAVAVAKHLEKYPHDDIVKVLHNVLDMDSFSEHLYSTLGEVFRGHGFPFQAYEARMKAAGSGSPLRLEYTKEATTGSIPPPLSSPKIGKWDDKNEAHVGGNQWQGGTGGSDTAGLGGRGGPYRLDRGHKVHQVSDAAKSEVSEEAIIAGQKIAQQALSDRLKEIGMSESEHETYSEFLEPINNSIANLRLALAATEDMASERGWIQRQLDGELDDSRLVDGLAGEKNIYRRRGIVEPTHNSGPSKRKKRLRFVVDCSGSMYRFNSYDQRLTRCLQATALVMCTFEGLGEKFDYSIVGHSGDSRCIELVRFGHPPDNTKERLRVLQTMVAHSQFCQSGDNTLGAIKQAIVDVSSPTHDDNAISLGMDDDVDRVGNSSVVIAISDANLERYGISPKELQQAMRGSNNTLSDTKAYCIFIASFGDEAEAIKRELPVGRGFVCMDSSELPAIVRNILTVEIA